MDKTIAVLLLIIAALLISFGYYAINNNPILDSQIEVQRVIDTIRIHDTIYQTKIKHIKDSFKVYMNHRDSILKDSTKIDSVLSNKIDSSKDIRINVIELKDSLTACNELLDSANSEITYKNAMIEKIDTLAHKKDPPNWRAYGVVAGTAFLFGILLAN